MSIRKHRVIVQLVDIDQSDAESRRRQNKTLVPVRADVRDQRTLILNLQNPHTLYWTRRELTFDVVGKSTDAHTRSEISTKLMDELLYLNHDCCLLRFNIRRDHCPFAFLSSILVTEIDKRMQRLHNTIIDIQLEYFDVQKYDMINMLEMSNNHQQMDDQFRCHFSSTKKLLQWLQSEFIYLWSAGKGHECFDVIIKYSEANGISKHTVKFSLLQLYLGLMDNDTKKNLKAFLESLGNRNYSIKQNMLIECVRDYFSDEVKVQNYHNWLMFDVPIMENEGSSLTDEVLEMAVAAYTSLGSFERKEEVKRLLNLKNSNGARKKPGAT